MDTELDLILGISGGILGKLHALSTAFFSRESAGKTYVRRPPLSLRVPAVTLLPDDPPARLVLLPSWSNRKVLDPTKVNAELLVDRYATGKTKLRSTEIAISLSRDRKPYTCKWSLRHGEHALDRLLRSAEAFTSDPVASVTRNVDGRCGICGRGLIDELPMARGIGPCCLRKMDFFRQWMEQTEAGKELQAVDS